MSLHPFMVPYFMRNLFAVSWHACLSGQSVVGGCSKLATIEPPQVSKATSHDRMDLCMINLLLPSQALSGCSQARQRDDSFLPSVESGAYNTSLL